MKHGRSDHASLSPTAPLFGEIRRGLRYAIATAVLCIAVALPAPSEAVPIEFNDGDALSISLLTIGPGDQVNTFFGHNGIIVEDHARGLQILYHYGLFSFGPDMLARYMMGHLVFSTGRVALGPDLAFYKASRRDIRIDELVLPSELRLEIARRLDSDAQPENRDYAYHHYTSNCSTRLRDLLDEVLGGQLRKALSKPARLSLREHTRRYAEVNPVVDLALLLWMNDDMERPIEHWDETFLPDVLAEELAAFRYTAPDGKTVPLIGKREVYFDSGRPPTPRNPSPIFGYALAFGVAMGGLGVLLTRRRWAAPEARGRRMALGAHHALAGLIYGVPGTLLFLMGTFTEHAVTHRNENLLFCNILTFVIFPLGIAVVFGSKRAERWAGNLWTVLALGAVAAIALKVLPAFDQANAVPLVLIAPANLGFAWAARMNK